MLTFLAFAEAELRLMSSTKGADTTEASEVTPSTASVLLASERLPLLSIFYARTTAETWRDTSRSISPPSTSGARSIRLSACCSRRYILLLLYSERRATLTQDVGRLICSDLFQIQMVVPIKPHYSNHSRVSSLSQYSGEAAKAPSSCPHVYYGFDIRSSSFDKRENASLA